MSDSSDSPSLPMSQVGMAPEVARLPRTYVPRLSLWSRLEASTGSAMVTVVAPAGAGKTLGVAGWLHDVRSRSIGSVVWLDASTHLDPTHLDAVLRAAAPSPMAGRAHPQLVIVDDAHDLPASALRLLDARLNESPQDMRVMLLSRWDLPLTRLAPQLLGHLTELRGDTLRLSVAESARLIEQHVGPTLPEVVSAITALAEGWCAVVVLASRLVAASSDQADAVRRVSQGNYTVADQIVSEVFATLTARERHLLLCTAGEGVVTAETASHLTHDRGAGLVLDGLVSSGLLVTRSESGTVSSSSHSDDAPGRDGSRFRIHRLLVEVVRRRVMAGGVDVERARSTVLRAVRLDLASGASDDAFRRLVDLGLAAAAAEQLAEQGTRLLMRGQAKDVLAFAHRWPEVLEMHPESWFVIGVERWVHGDIPSAMHWFDRLVVSPPSILPSTDRLTAQRMCARLMRSRAGFEPLARAAQDGQEFIGSPAFSRTPPDLQPHVLAELGIVQSTLGMLVQAEGNLSRAALLGDELELPAHAASALTHLAGIYYMRGSEHVAAKLAVRSLDSMQCLGLGAHVARRRGEIFASLAALSTLPMPEAPRVEEHVSRAEAPLQPVDIVTSFWQQILDAGLHLSRGSVIRAERTLHAVLDAPGLPLHLRATLLIERGFVAALCDDRAALRHLAHDLAEHGSPGESLLLRGVLADLAGDLNVAVEHLAGAAEGSVLDQPPCRALALVCQAQLLQTVGDPQAARVAMLGAVRATASRGNFVPFLGWSRHGTAVHTVLAGVGELGTHAASSWLSQLVAHTRDQPDLIASMATWTATAQERSSATEPLVMTHLSPRERDVLRELARGATYADIALGLFVSENTVKTHVSSLYSKLGVNRRSQALAVARRLELL